jgi:hypothetical protein
MAVDNDTENTLPQPSSQPRPQITAGAGPVLPLVPRNFEEVIRYSKMILLAGAVPDSLREERGRQLPDNEVVARVVAVIAAGSEVGMGPMAAMANIALINRKRVIWGAGAVAVLQASGHLEDMKVERIGSEPGASIATAQFADDFGIKVTLKRKGLPTPYVGEFTVGAAKRGHLWLNTNKKPWIEFPEKMLFWRAFNNAVGAGFGDCMAGLAIREVVADEPPPVRQLTDTSFLDAPRRDHDTEAESTTVEEQNAALPEQTGGEPSPEPVTEPPSEESPPPAQEPPSEEPPPTRRTRRPRRPPGDQLRLDPEPEPEKEQDDVNDRPPPDPDV